ncbi:protein-glucosylgalactosylhydroxylysine glucosidase isoform X3 [Oryctolagus cuniculus]|uniref:protein-glucosylgalactosylhydroxylysine glucosidase isoform X3 n=1 Tax=Oryctolagus cuniculus TaxID=9986 RepID=UPI003879E9E9
MPSWAWSCTLLPAAGPSSRPRRPGGARDRGSRCGSFQHTLEGPSSRASQRIYAHRTLPHVLAVSVSLTRLATGHRPITVLLQSAFSPESPDLDLQLGPDFKGARYLHGHTLTPEQPGGVRQEVHMLWTPVPPALTLGEGEEDRTWEFLTVVGSSQAEAQACFTEALQLQARGTLYPAHAQAWAQLWAGCGLDVVGPLHLRQALRGSLYYLLSALPQPGATGYVCHGLSPGGLSNGSREECYWGHVFWDQDLWMFPNILMFHPEAARAILEYRIRTLDGALENARSLGYKGAKFAWESAGSGLEVCPEEVYGAQELHINGAVLLAFELYYNATQDLQLFREAGGWDVVSAVADFWCSRVEWSPKEKKYHLRGVMPPDEYHAGVDNSVYTNALVQSSLRFAAALAQDLGLPVPDQWLEVADEIKVPFDPERNFHPEFDGYEPGEEVKQADVVLLGYPVPFPLPPDVRRRNLEIYEAATSSQGPAMTWVREHVCCGLDGAEGSGAGTGPPGQELCQHHRALQGVDRERRWVRSRELPDGHGRLPAGFALWVYRVQGHQNRPELRPRVPGGHLQNVRLWRLPPGEQDQFLLLPGLRDSRGHSPHGARGAPAGGRAVAITVSAAPADRTQGLLSTLSRPDTEVPPIAAWKSVSRTLTHSSRPPVPHPGTCPEQPGLSWALSPCPLCLHLLHPPSCPATRPPGSQHVWPQVPGSLSPA